jgi:hypothetical protein
MKFIFISVAVMAAAYFMGINRNTAVRWLGQGILLALTLAVAGGVLFCIVFPIVKPETESGVLILVVIPLALVGYIPWTLLRLARDVVMTRDFTPAQKEQFVKEKIDDLEADLQKQLEQDLENVNKFWISPAKRRRLRQNISHNRLMLAGFKKIEAEMQKQNKEPDKDG